MSKIRFQLGSPPIVEAVVDIDCDLPSALDFPNLQSAAAEAFQPQYPLSQVRYAEEHFMRAQTAGEGTHSSRHRVHALQFKQEDAKQLIQVRAHGYSFNRLAPYSSLDDYMGEIRRTWDIFRSLTGPSQIRGIRLRYINRILLPIDGGTLDFDQFLKSGPRLPAKSGLEIASFFNQYAAVEPGTGNVATVSLMAQEAESERLPVILDISAAGTVNLEPDSPWTSISSRIQSLRKLKNHIFKNTLTAKCLALFHDSP